MRRALFLSVPLALFSAACSYNNGDAQRALDEQTACQDSPSEPIQTGIDTDAKIETQPAHGAGVYVEYSAGGHWLLRTTCDTGKNAPPCAWDIIVTPEDGRSISNVAGYDLEASTDSFGEYPQYPASYQFLASTSDDEDGIAFDTEPGTAIAVDSFLDGACALPYVFWVGDGAAHTGAPSNPLVLIPTHE